MASHRGMLRVFFKRANRLEGSHWAYEIARQIIRKQPKSKSTYTIQSSISPSGTIHVGNFRDTVVAWAVAQAMRHEGRKASLILCFDDADPLRGTSLSSPEVGKPLSEVTLNNENLARSRGLRYQEELEKIGIKPDVTIYQSDLYFRSSSYNELISRNIDHLKAIIKALNRFRETTLPKTWLPLVCFCEKCKKQVLGIRYQDEAVSYECRWCGYMHNASLRETRFKKLVWRLDWPMRCFRERIDFEPCGADHFSHGSTMTTSKEIFDRLYHEQMPLVRPYEFVKLSGSDKKISSSAGDGISLKALSEIFPRELIIWLYLSRKLMSPIILDIENGFFGYYRRYYEFVRKISDGKASLMESQLARLLALPMQVNPDPQHKRFIVVKEICFVSQSLGYRTARIMEYFKCRFERYGWSSEFQNLLLLQLEYCKNWLTTYADPRWVIKLMPPNRIESKHVNCAKQLLYYLDHSTSQLVIEDSRLAYKTLLNRSDGPRLRTLLTFWDQNAL